MPDVNMAIIGSGIFAREEHLPAILSSRPWGCRLKAIYSRSRLQAEKLADHAQELLRTKFSMSDPDSIAEPIEVFSEDSGAGRGYADLLAREDIAAVTIALPIPAQPDYIRQAIQAGKHVLSEKPIAKDLATALDLMQWYGSHTSPDRKVLWAVGENIRFQKKFIHAAEEMHGLGHIKSVQVSMHSMVTTDSKHYKTEWRKNPEYQGGFILDGGVHAIAALRHLLQHNEFNDHITAVSAHSSLKQPHLAPFDTVDAEFKLRNGGTGTLSLSYGSESKEQAFEFSDGDPSSLIVIADTVNGHDIEFDSRGVDYEMRSFARCITEKSGMVSRSLSPEEALGDLEIVEKMLQSSERDGEEMKLEYQNWWENTK